MKMGNKEGRREVRGRVVEGSRRMIEVEGRDRKRSENTEKKI